MPRKVSRDAPFPPILNDRGSGPALARRDKRNTDDPVSLGLRKLWEQVEQEPVPDALLALLDAIDTARSANASDAASELSRDDPAKASAA